MNVNWWLTKTETCTLDLYINIQHSTSTYITEADIPPLRYLHSRFTNTSPDVGSAYYAHIDNGVPVGLASSAHGTKRFECAFVMRVFFIWWISPFSYKVRTVVKWRGWMQFRFSTTIAFQFCVRATLSNMNQLNELSYIRRMSSINIIFHRIRTNASYLMATNVFVENSFG